jgi:4-carboxymuconolactone decarboxylase
VADESARWQAGLAAFASQFRVPEDEVLEFMRSRFGERLASEAIMATGAAWTDEVLTLRERSLVGVAVLAAQGGLEGRLRSHVCWALDHGATPDELDALAALLAVYAGYPRASAAAEVIREVVAEYEHRLDALERPMAAD